MARGWLVLVVAVMAMMLVGCPTSPTVVPEAPSGFFPVPTEYRTEMVRLPGASAPAEITYGVFNGLAIIGGDMVIGRIDPFTGQLKQPPSWLDASDGLGASGTGIPASHGLWPGGVIPYRVDSAMPAPQRVAIEQAIAHWEARTTIRFVEATSASPRSVTFAYVPDDIGVCFASVGASPDAGVWLTRSCDFGTVVHEIGHTVGFLHEHQRHDRDDFVEVFSGNIRDEFLYAFDVLPPMYSISTYDYASVMHYSKRSGMKPGLPRDSVTIRVRTPGVEIGSDVLSAGDIAAVNTMYADPWPYFSEVAVSDVPGDQLQKTIEWTLVTPRGEDVWCRVGVRYPFGRSEVLEDFACDAGSGSRLVQFTRTGEVELGLVVFEQGVSGSRDSVYVPLLVGEMANPSRELAAGAFFTLASRDDGTVWGWGYNQLGQLGEGTFATSRSTPTQVSGLRGIHSIAAGFAHALAVGNDDSVWGWGSNALGQMGDSNVGGRHLAPIVLDGFSDSIAVAAGNLHSLALRSDGTVWAVGENDSGQLGDGTTVRRSVPSGVVGLRDVIAIAAGERHSLALRDDGTVWAWGRNWFGQLGDGTQTRRLEPVQVTGLNSVVAIAAGSSHSLALRTDGSVWAWGFNGHGELGDGTKVSRSTPVRVGGLTGVAGIAAGGGVVDAYRGVEGFSLAVRADGTVWAWGANGYGQLGDDTTTDRSTAVRVGGLDGATAVAAGLSHSVVLMNDGTLWAWGTNTYGELGLGTSTGDLTPHPTPVPSLPMYPSINVAIVPESVTLKPGAMQTFAASVSGTSNPAVTWSATCGNITGTGSTVTYTAPASVPAGGSCLVRGASVEDDDAWAEAVVTIEPDTNDPSPVVPRIAAGGLHSLALRSDGTVWAWGNNRAGTLGDGTTNDRLTPVQVSSLNSVTSIAAGTGFSLALHSDGTVWAWGYNEYGQLGDGTTNDRLTPVQVSGLSNVTAIAAGARNSMALRSDGTVWAWGYNEHGQLGDGTTNDRMTPVPVSTLNSVTSIAAGYWHSLALRSDGTVWAWGRNETGQIGDGTSTNHLTPVQVSGLSDVTCIAAGRSHSLALRADGAVWAWGINRNGQLGDGTTNDRLTPVQVSGLSAVTSITAGADHSSTVRTDGTVWAWGMNIDGQLGDGTTTGRLAPVQVSGLTGITSVAAGWISSLALRTDDAVWAWGGNNSGQLGDGTTTDRLMPVRVSGF